MYHVAVQEKNKQKQYMIINSLIPKNAMYCMAIMPDTLETWAGRVCTKRKADSEGVQDKSYTLTEALQGTWCWCGLQD